MDPTHPILGAPTSTEAVTEEIQQLVQSLKTDVEKELNRKFKIFHAISYKSQLVSGTNYFVKILVGDANDYIHVYIYRPLPQSKNKPCVNGVQTDKKLFDDIHHFSGTCQQQSS
uniref:cystatin-B-like n=1 Tax=Pristiophorus japonicus TaxID=55135 RepID=UPI00398E41A2